jgi:hypothetical protein
MMTELEKLRRRRIRGGGAIVFLLIAFPLVREMWEPRHPGWNAFLVVCAIGMIVAASLLERFFVKHAGEIGEARFDTRNKSDFNV